MSTSLTGQQELVSTMIADLVAANHIHDEIHGIRRARNAAEALATEVAVLAAMSLPIRVHFARTTGQEAARQVRLYR
jgi:hypothetical protein